MRHTTWLLLAALALSGVSGCSHHRKAAHHKAPADVACTDGDSACPPGGPYGAAGPPTAAVTYPYYTTRGPRDFLAEHPRDIGP